MDLVLNNMKNKVYIAPAIKAREVKAEPLLSLSPSETGNVPVHTDDPQEPGNALSRGHYVWDD